MGQETYIDRKIDGSDSNLDVLVKAEEGIHDFSAENVVFVTKDDIEMGWEL